MWSFGLLNIKFVNMGVLQIHKVHYVMLFRYYVYIIPFNIKVLNMNIVLICKDR
jgi:hypothetical protein